MNRVYFFTRAICLLAIGLLSIVNIQAQVNIQINSGDPAFPFPQFLPYEFGSNHSLGNLGTQNGPGVTHAEMEKRIRDAYHIMFNRAEYEGGTVDGVQLVHFYSVPDVTEGDGYALLAAAYMADKEMFDGLWMWIHENRMHGSQKHTILSYLDGTPIINSPSNGSACPGWVGPAADCAADGDFDIGLALLMAYKQWGEFSGVMTAAGEMNYLTEATDFIRAFAELENGNVPDPATVVTGSIGLDGYIKGGDTWQELTDWATPGYLGYIPEYKGGTQQHIDYYAPGYFRPMREFMEVQGADPFITDQLQRGEASSDWLMGKMMDNPTTLPLAGWVSLNGTTPTYSNFVDGEDFRNPWRTILNYVWHGDPEYTWDPVNHSIIPNTPNSYEQDIANRLATFLANPQASPWNNPCSNFGGGPDITYFGPTTLKQYYDPNTGTENTTFTLNWLPGAASPAAIASQDFDLMGELYRQCAIEWDGTGAGLDSKPVYFHGWFRLLGMLTLSGNLHTPTNMEAAANMKVYRSVNRTFGFTGDNFVDTIKYRNYGSLDATGCTVTYTLDDDLDFVSASNGGVYNTSTRTVTWSVGTVDGFTTGNLANTQGQFTVEYIANENADGRYCPIATISCTNGSGWTSNEYPNNCTAVMERNCIDIIKRSLIIDKFADREEYNEGDEAIFTIEFENSSEAGFLDGGRPGVVVTYAHDGLATPAAANQNWMKVRLLHGAVEPYIDYGNYRISYYLNSPLKCYVGDAGCVTGWDFANTVYEGGDPANVEFFPEEMVPGSDANGSWNQRLVLKFAEQLATTTPQLSNYFGIPNRIHEGGLEPMRGVWRIFTSNNSLVDWSTSWSWDPTAVDADDGLMYPVSPNWADINNPAVVVDRYHPSSCEMATQTVENVLVEEWDGFTWRRVMGNGPASGRDIDNVVIRDTLPAGLTWGGFIDQEALGIQATHIVSGGFDIVEWTIPKLQVNAAGDISYKAIVSFPSGNTCTPTPIPNEEINNKAWIYGDTESPIYGEDTITVTCDVVNVCPDLSSMTLTPSSTTHAIGDQLTYTLEYTQTNGTIISIANDADWFTAPGFTGALSVSGGTIDLNGGWNDRGILYRYSHGTNGTVSGHFNLAQHQEPYGILLRHDGTDYLDVRFKQTSSAIEVSFWEGGTQIGTTQTYPWAGTDFDFQIQLVGGTANVWIDDLTLATPPISQSGVTVRAGYAGVHAEPGNAATLTNWGSHLDSGFEIMMKDPIPGGIVSPINISDGGSSDGTNINWTLATGSTPVLYGTQFTRTWEGTVDICDDIFSIAYVNILGHDTDEIGACVTTICANPPACEDPGIVSLNIASTEDVCGTTLEIIATPSGTEPTGGFEYEFFYDNGSGFTSVQAASSDSTYDAIAAGDYYVEVTDPSDATTCSSVSTTSTITFSSPLTPSITIDSDATIICTGETVNFAIDAAMDSGTSPSYQWLLNNIPISLATGLTYSSSTLSNGDIISLEITISETCNTKSIDTSNQIAISVGAPLTPEVTIVSDENTICTGETVNFSIDAAIDSGATPAYRWLVNDVAVNLATDNIFSTSTLNNGDIVSLEMTITESCNTKSVDTSNQLVIAVSPILDPDVTISSDVLTVCNGGEVNFSIDAAVDSGATPTYRWLVNDVVVGLETNNTFSTSTLNDGDVVALEMTIAETCYSQSIDTSNEVTISVGSPLTPEVAITSDANTVCAGETVNFSLLTAVDSGVSPSFQWLLNGNPISSENNTTLSINSLNNSDVVSLEMIISESCQTKGQDTSNTIAITVSSTVAPTAVLTATTPINICPGDSVAIEITEQNGAGSSPTYEWYINNVLDGSQTTDIFSSQSLTNGDSVYVIISDLSSCASATSVVSQAIYINEIAPLTPSINIISSSNTICAGENVDFSISSAVDLGATPSFQWLLNDVAITSETGLTYSSSTLTNGDVISLEMTITETCHTKAVDTSNIETIVVTSPLTPQIEIEASATTICAGESVDFSILTAVDSGTTPSYEWLLNGNPITAQMNNTLSISNLNDNDSIAIIMTSSESCVTTSKDTSMYLPVAVTGAIDPEVVIAATTATTICAGDSVAFEVTTTIGDNGSPAFEWLINGVSTSQTGTTFFSKTLEDEDTVTVRMSGTSSCATVNDTLSNPIGISITPAGVPAITIDADKNLICAGEEVDFSITSQANEGTNPTYEWLINTVSSGTGTTFSSISLVNGDDVSVIMTSDLSCAATPTATSNVETIQITTPVTPEINIEVDNTSPCAGDIVVFDTLSTIHQGNSPTFQWLLNGNPITAEMGESYSSSALISTDIISVQMTVVETCVTSTTVESNEISITPASGVASSIELIPSSTDICITDQVTLTTTSTNEGINPSYAWYINDVLQLSTSNELTTDIHFDSEVKVTMTSSASCSTAPTVSDSVDITVYTAPLPFLSIPSTDGCDTMELVAIPGLSNTTIQWYNDFGLIADETNEILSITESGTYYFMESNGVCAAGASNVEEINVYETPIANAGADISTFGEEVTLGGTIQATSGTTWEWSPSASLDNELSLTPKATPVSTTTYTLTADNNGCIHSDEVTVYVKELVKIPNVFSPNGDTEGDTWVIAGLDTYEDCIITVYNRWGMKVFNQEGYDNAWDGCASNGQLLPIATYYYVLDLGDGSEPVSGTVSIVK